MNSDDLDRQLKAALGAQPSTEQAARLIAFWRQRSRTERRRRRMVHATALAATLLTAVAASRWLVRARAPEPATVAEQAPTSPTPQDSPSPTVVRIPHEIRDPRSAGRSPTAYEQAVFAAVTRTSVDVHARALGVEVDSLIERLAADPGANAGERARAASLADRGAENILLRRLSRAEPHERRAIVQLLAACGSARCAPALLDVARRDQLRPDALAALEQILGVDSLAQVVPMTHHREVRAALLQRLLTANSPVALRNFLQIASNRALRPVALAAAMSCPEFPVESLLASLEDENKQIRLAAAIVLGHVDGPQVAQSLIAIASRRDGAPVEAWVALLACRDAAADRFLAQASIEPRWLGQVNNARVYWARFIP
jgi:hypothetical protein